MQWSRTLLTLLGGVLPVPVVVRLEPSEESLMQRAELTFKLRVGSVIRLCNDRLEQVFDLVERQSRNLFAALGSHLAKAFLKCPADERMLGDRCEFGTGERDLDSGVFGDVDSVHVRHLSRVVSPSGKEGTVSFRFREHEFAWGIAQYQSS